MNLASAILQRASRDPRAVAIVDGEQVLRYGELADGVCRTAAALAARGVQSGAVVGLASSHVGVHLIVTLAVALLGASTMPLGARSTEEERLGPLRRAGARFVIGERKLRAGESFEGFEYIAADRSLIEGVQPAREPGWGPDCRDLAWRMSLSSGTTGEPKVIAVSHTHALTQFFAQQCLLPLGVGTRVFTAVGLNTTFGLNPCLRQLLFGGTVVAYSSKMSEAVALCERHGVTHLVSSPATAAKLVDPLPDDGPRLPDLHLHLGGGSVSAGLQEKVQRRLTSKIWSIYGASEIGMIAIADPQDLQAHPGAAGHIVPWVQAEAVDRNGNPLPTGRTGELRFRSLAGCRGYLDDPETTARFLRDGWFHPGDFGQIGPDGLMRVEGRMDDVINIGGVKLLPTTIEQVLEQHADVAEAAAFPVKMPGGELALVAAVVSRGEFDQDSVLAHCRERLRGGAPVRVFPVSSLPRNDMGKIQRRELAARIRLGPAGETKNA